MVLLAASSAGRLWSLCRATPSLPLWDEAAHAMAGIEVADALRHWSPIELALALNRQVVWPFVHSLLLAPGFLVAGPSVGAAEATSVALYGVALVLLFVAGTRLHAVRGAWVGLAAAALALLAPAWGLFGTLVMLEVPGALLVLTAFALHARAAREPRGGPWLRAAGVASAALFLCKYNYGLMWLAPLSLWEWRLLPAESRARAWAGLRARVRSPRFWLRPMPLLFALGAIAIAAILATGGAEFGLAGRRVSLHSPGNLAYVLWLAWLAWWFVPRRARGAAPDAAPAGTPVAAPAPPRASRATWLWARLPDRARVLAVTIGVPLAGWLTLPWPNRVREFFGFVANRDSGVPFWQPAGLMFYPRALAADYAPAAWVGWAALALALVPPLGRRDLGGAPAPDAGGAAGRGTTPGERLGPAGDPAWLAWLAFAIGLVATVVHPYRDSRFLFTVTPLLWLCAARRVVALGGAVLARVPWRAIREAAWLAAAAALMAAAWIAAPSTSALAARRAAFRGPARLAPLIDATLAAVADARRDEPRARVVMLGYSNALSPGLLAWRARIERPEWPPSRLPGRAPYVEPGADESVLAGRLDWLESHADLVLVVLADSVGAAQRPEYARETWADRETVERMREDAGRWRPWSARRTPGGTVEGFRVDVCSPREGPRDAGGAAAVAVPVTPSRRAP